MINHGKRSILGVGVNAIDYEAAVARVIEAAHQGRPLTLSALAVHGVMTGALDPVHRARLNALDVVCPDGQPVRWALGWLHGAWLRSRVYGPELMLRVCAAAAEAGLPVYLYGSREEVLDALERNLTARLPGLRVVGRRPSRFRQLTVEEQREAAEVIRASGARIVFAGLGCPRQEVWAYEMRSLLPVPVLAVGAAFDFHAGRLAQAPPSMQSRGLEWLFRLLTEPSRLWRRYVLLNPLYLALASLQFTGAYVLGPGRPPRDEEAMRYG
jgi:N-acetylglucosaminyldiphosphoundecaprenol N-acetyl-beta-D-mannosaminyltransferase